MYNIFGIISFAIFFVVVLTFFIEGVLDYFKCRKVLIYYLDYIQLNDVYKKWFYTNQIIKEFIANRISSKKEDRQIILKRFLFCVLKHNDVICDLKKFYMFENKIYDEYENICEVSVFLVPKNSIVSNEFETKLFYVETAINDVFREAKIPIMFTINVIAI